MLIALPASAQAPSIEGSYKLLSRTLPDGTVLRPPVIMGIITYTKTHRNSNVIVRDPGGKFQSFSTMSTYSLSASEYSESLMINIVNDQIGGNPIVYDVSGSTQTVPVKAEGTRIEFKPPFDPPAYVFDGGNFTATFANGTVDAWEKLP